MPCEMCGKDVPRLRKVQIGSSELEVCNECAKFGADVHHEAPKSEPEASGPAAVAPARTFESPPSRRRDALSRGEMELAEDYHKRIARGRQRKGLTQEELAKRINEKKSVISRCESGEMRPSDRLVRKLEKELDVKLMERLEFQVEATIKDKRRTPSGSVSLCDLIKMEK